jgi:hypothetical protein
VDIVVPVRNEERDLAPSVRRLAGYLREGFPFTARVTVADNGSTDGTWAIAGQLAREYDEVRAVRLEEPGRGRALRAIWSQSDAEVLAYMDVDLSTDLLLRGVMSAQPANVLSLLVTAVANTAANRRLTFGISGRQHAARHQVKGLIAFGVGLALTSGALAVRPAPARGPRGTGPGACCAGLIPIRAGRARRCSGCWRSPRCSTCGT